MSHRCESRFCDENGYRCANAHRDLCDVNDDANARRARYDASDDANVLHPRYDASDGDDESAHCDANARDALLYVH